MPLSLTLKFNFLKLLNLTLNLPCCLPTFRQWWWLALEPEKTQSNLLRPLVGRC
jgi:hypothetical protein